MKTKDLRSMDQTVINEALTRQVATVMLSGASVADCAKKLTLTANAVRTITSSDRYKEIVATTAEEELAPALAKAKAQIARLTTKAVAALERALDDGSTRDSLQAATIVLKAVGLHEDEKQSVDTQLTVIMPNSATPEPRTIEVQNEEN